MIAEAFFAGRLFVHAANGENQWLMWGTDNIMSTGPAMHVVTTIAEPATGAFMCKVNDGWLLVAGRHRGGVRHTFHDQSARADEHAAEVQTALGIPVLSVVEANDCLRAEGVCLWSITGEEKRRVEGLTRHQSAG